MPCLHFVGGRKGGVGKSMFASLLIAYADQNWKDFVIAECDRVNPDVARAHKGYQKRSILAYFSEDERKRSKADALFAEARTVPVIANLPAQVHEAMKGWFIQDALYEIAQGEGVTFRHWYVSNGGYDSVRLFSKTVRDLGEWVPHVFVRNWGLCDDWERSKDDDAHKEFLATVNEFEVPVIDMPKIPYLERNFLEAHQIPFNEAVAHEGLSVVSRQRIRNALRHAFTEIEKVRAL